MFTLQSRTTPMGNRAHLVRTDESDFAQRLFDQVHAIDLEPDFSVFKHGFDVEFVAADDDAEKAIQVALESAL